MGAQPPANLLPLAAGLQLHWAGWEVTPEGGEECADGEAGGGSLTLPSKREENKNVEECINKSKRPKDRKSRRQENRYGVHISQSRARGGERIIKAVGKPMCQDHDKPPQMGHRKSS